MRIVQTLALVSAKERLLGLKTTTQGYCNKTSRPPAGREWDALPIFIILESGDCITFAMPDGPHRRGEGGGAYAYAPARHSAVFLFGCLRRWTRDRGCDIAHLILLFCRNFFARVGVRGRADRPTRDRWRSSAHWSGSRAALLLRTLTGSISGAVTMKWPRM